MDRVVLKLTGSQAERGLPLANLATFVVDFRRALRDFDRSRRAERTARGGRPAAREDLVTAFRLVEMKPGSTLLTLEPIPPAALDAEAEPLAEVETLALENLAALLETVSDERAPLDAAVTDAVASARRALGTDGAIEIRIGDARHRVVIDKRRVRDLEMRVRRYDARELRISGRLHMIDVEPDKVGIRASDGVDWVCSYPEALESDVTGLLGKHVTARGVGQLQNANRGTLAIDAIRPVDEFEQTPLFTFERIPLEELLADQGVTAPRGAVSILPDDLSDDEADRYLEALLDAR